MTLEEEMKKWARAVELFEENRDEAHVVISLEKFQELQHRAEKYVRTQELYEEGSKRLDRIAAEREELKARCAAQAQTIYTTINERDNAEARVKEITAERDELEAKVKDLEIRFERQRKTIRDLHIELRQWREFKRYAKAIVEGE